MTPFPSLHAQRPEVHESGAFHNSLLFSGLVFRVPTLSSPFPFMYHFCLTPTTPSFIPLNWLKGTNTEDNVSSTPLICTGIFGKTPQWNHSEVSRDRTLHNQIKSQNYSSLASGSRRVSWVSFLIWSTVLFIERVSFQHNCYQ